MKSFISTPESPSSNSSNIYFNTEMPGHNFQFQGGHGKRKDIEAVSLIHYFQINCRHKAGIPSILDEAQAERRNWKFVT